MAVMLIFRFAIAVVFTMTVFAVAATSHAQTMEQQGYRPVDQTIEDIDPLGVSLRKVDPGLLTIGERTNVYRRIVPGQTSYDQQQTGRLYFISYGVIAEYDQSQYIYLYDRKGRPAGIAQSIPPNTVFHLGLPKNDVTKSADLPLAPGQVDGRITGLLDNDPVPNERASYDQLVRRQREVVVGALRRTSP